MKEKIDPIFSVVIPAYNRQTTIIRSIESVLNQTFKDFEIIVVDDGSTDNTYQLVNELSDSRIKYIKQINSGATSARNNGIMHSQGQYISFLDSDDEWFPNMLEMQLKEYKSDNSIGCVYSNVQLVIMNGKAQMFSKKLGVSGNSYSEVLSQGYLAPTTVLSAKRKCFEIVGMFDVELPASQDDDMCFRLAKEYKIGFISEVLANMYCEQSNRISNNINKVALGWWMLWNKFETDVVVFCGNKIMAAHYYDCALLFAKAGNTDMANLALLKIEKYGGKYSYLQKKTIMVLLRSKGLFNRILYRLIKTIFSKPLNKV